MKTILIAWEFGSGLGHLVRLLPLIKRWTESHRVILVLRSADRTGRIFEGCDVTIINTPGIAINPAEIITPARTFSHILSNTILPNTASVIRFCSEWKNIFDRFRPDIVVCDHSPGAILAARICKLKTVNLGTGFFHPPDTVPMQDLLPDLNPDEQGMIRHEESVLRIANSVLEHYQCEPMDRLVQLYSDITPLLLTFPELDHFARNSQTVYWGAWNISGGAPARWPDSSSPKIFAYLKAKKRFRDILEGFRRFDGTFLVYLDELTEQIRNEFSRSNIQFVEQRLDLLDVADRCDLAVLNAGHDSTVSMLLAGKPTLHFPLTTEQLLFAKRIDYSKAGIYQGFVMEKGQIEIGGGIGFEMPDFDFPEHVHKRLNEAFDSDEIRQGAQQFSEKYAAYDQHQAATLLAEHVVTLAEEESLPLNSRSGSASSVALQSSSEENHRALSLPMLHVPKFTRPIVTFRHLGRPGTLGDQMFQIAATVGIAVRHRLEYVFPPWKYSKYFNSKFPETVWLPSTDAVIEMPGGYREIKLRPNRSYHLFGRFVSDKYFAHCKETVIALFEPCEQSANYMDKYLKDNFGSSNPDELCAIHVVADNARRGGRYVDLLRTGYYAGAINSMKQQMPDMRFLVFSDNPVFCRSYFVGEEFHVSEDHVDAVGLLLASRCSYQIIANTTESWWAARLGGVKIKKTIAPEKWFVG